MTGCSGFKRYLQTTRREFVTAGAAGAVGLTLPGLLRSQAQAAGPKPKAKSVILVYLLGGPSHIDMWDMKPNGPSPIRGEFKPIATRLPGTVFCEYLPQLSQVNDQFSLIRTVTHDRNVHGGAVGFVLTGTRTADPGIPGVRGPDASPNDHPTLGSVVRKYAPAKKAIPTSVTLPWDMIDGQGRFIPGQTAAMFGRKFDPWFVKSDPNDPKFRIEGLQLAQGLSANRLDSRRELLASIDTQKQHIERIAQVADLDAYYQQAFSLLTSADTHAAFDIRAEPTALRDRYGRNTFGQSCLLARRLVESGVRFVQVNMGNRLTGAYGWDTHTNNFNIHREELLPKFDPGLTTLLKDLGDRGMLEDTLLVCMSEFGRSPRISSRAGRDHWPQCYTILMAGAGVRTGFEYGRSDAQGAYPLELAVTPEDVVATIYSALGIDYEGMIYDQFERPHKLVAGHPITGIFA